MSNQKETWQKRFLAPSVQIQKINLFYYIKDFFEILIYSIWFHKPYEVPNEELPKFGLFDNADDAYIICHELYDNANKRIKLLEEKAYKLLPYISALFAFISFVFMKTSICSSRIFYILALIAMFISILVSFRCVNIKTKMEYFVPTIFDFTHEKPRPKLNKKYIAHELLEMAIFNQNVADSIADMLKCARHLLVISIVFSIIGFIISAQKIVFENQNDAKVNINIESIKFN